ncbi:MAG: MBL fold metallo-hydrolase [Dehalococcoidales bacterium]|nr:MBL fold metallo-hydrolase [Dehalococcoidales bacterium]
MQVKITTLAENTAGMSYLAEWGLSMLVEADGRTILFDTGMGTAAVHNARIFGIDLSTVDKIVISHGHHDHTGGLREVLGAMRKKIEVIAHPDIWAAKYGRSGKSPAHYAGMPFRRELLENLGAEFKLTAEPVRITDHIMTLGEIPMLTDYEEIDRGLLEKKAGEMLPDELKDDLAMVIDTDYGLVVILGCSHRGIVNTLKQAQKVTGKKLIYAAVGGTHLLNATRERLEKTAADLKEMGVQYLGASHCTGFKAAAYLAQEFGDRFFVNNSGSRWTLPFS